MTKYAPHFLDSTHTLKSICEGSDLDSSINDEAPPQKKSRHETNKRGRPVEGQLLTYLELKHLNKINNSFRYLNLYSIVEKLGINNQSKINLSFVYSKNIKRAIFIKKLNFRGNRVKFRLTGLICWAILLKNGKRGNKVYPINPIVPHPVNRLVFMGKLVTQLGRLTKYFVDILSSHIIILMAI
ncbi:hypothetical protein BpHYR1_006192 [Brachionus plicatilis]|uniref:Uncharacterized protein n=1 Tax=Brachionus plicatilis TaxID=10195 RepID=A0A3M7PV80_BRAPC|nr:hypothetical protein BpHYR1_006192 [Brachionus plicatilis]